MQQEIQTESVGSVNPSPDANDDALFEQLGFGGNPAQPQPVRDDRSMPEPVHTEPKAEEPLSENPPENPPEPPTKPPEDGGFDFPEDLNPSSLPPKTPDVSSPEVKKPETVSEPEPEPEPTETKFNDPKANHAFAELRHRNGELQRELAELKQQLDQSREQGPAVEEIKAQYEEQIKSLEEQIGQYDLSFSPSFRQKYDSVLNNILGRIVNMIKKSGASDEEANRIVSDLRTKSTIDRANELNDFAPALSGPVVNLFEDFDDLMFKREADLRNWRESKKAIEEEERRLGKSKTLQIADTLASSTLKQLSSERNPFYTFSANDKNWNQKVSGRINTYKGLLKSGNPEVLAKLVAEGLTADDFKKMYFAERDRRLSYEKLFEERRGFSGSPSNQPQLAARAPSKVLQSKNDDELLTSLGF